MIKKVKLSIFATFYQGESKTVGYATQVSTLELDLSKERDPNTQGRISMRLAVFLEKYIDQKAGREDRELISISHSLIAMD